MGHLRREINHTTKVLSVINEGAFTPEDGQNAVQAYLDDVSQIHAPDYTLDIDSTKLEMHDPEVLPQLAYFFDLYKKSGFKKVIYRVRNNPILTMQLKSVANKTGLHSLEIIEE